MKRNGFTLIELMVVVAIIGILSASTAPTVIGLIDKAKRAKAASEIRAIATALIAYKNDNGVWPDLIAQGYSAHHGIRHPLNYLMPTGTGTRYLTKYPWPDPWGRSCGYRMHLTTTPGSGFYHSFVVSRGPNGACDCGSYHAQNQACGDDDIFYLQ
jgi:general secretion pathway protein G